MKQIERSEAEPPFQWIPMLRRYVEQILSLYNYIDGIMVCDTNAVVEFYTNFRPDINSLTEDDVLGKHLLQIYPYLNENTSSILSVLRTGVPIYNKYQNLMNSYGESIRAVNTTLPIKSDHSEIIGVVDVSRYLDSKYTRRDIKVALKNAFKPIKSNGLYTIDDIYNESKFMYKIKEKIAKIADTPSSVLIVGETGTGKELIAQAIHTRGARCQGPFISQNCSAIPSSLLEGILFGTEKGSYTGATNRAGLLEIANGGTLFLDEINSMDIAMQPKILKAIEEKRIRRIGSNRTIDLEFRVISASNEDPHGAVEQGRMRKDLFFRLTTVMICIPPLRERTDDIRFLTKCFIRDFSSSMNMQVIGVTEEVEAIFDQYPWPGNVRELKNVIEGAFNVISSRFIKRADLPDYILNAIALSGHRPEPGTCETIPLRQAIWDFERGILMDVLSHSDTLTDAAQKLNISKQTLSYKISKFKIKRLDTDGASPWISSV